MARTPPPEVPRGRLDEAALGLWFTRYKAWSAELQKERLSVDARLVALEGGDTAVASSADGTDFGSYRHKPGNASLSTWNLAGVVAGSALAAAGAIGANLIFAFPFVAPKRGGTLSAIAYEGGNGIGVARMGVYANAADDSLYPGTLLYDGGNVANSAAVKTFSPSLALTAGALYWLGWIIDDGTGSARKLVAAHMGAMLGAPLGATTMNHGITVTATGGSALASTYPAGGAYVDVGATASPALGYRVS